MHASTKIFWTVVALLLTTSGIFSLRTAHVRAELARASIAVRDGEIVTFVAAADGDTFAVRGESGADVVVRLLGVKAVDAPHVKEGSPELVALARSLEERPLRLALATPPRDAHGRVLASLFDDHEDVGLRLVREGHAIVFTTYPFPAMPEYLDAQRVARLESKGLWSDPERVRRADVLQGSFRSGSR